MAQIYTYFLIKKYIPDFLSLINGLLSYKKCKGIDTKHLIDMKNKKPK